LEHGEFCKYDVVRVVGVEHATEAAAKEAAIRQWQATVRYDYGERYLDIDNARHMRWRCDRSGTNETVAGRVESAVTGGAGYLKRCIVSAVPCMMPLHRTDKEEGGARH
jgi:type IV secretory pathway component VirB8